MGDGPKRSGRRRIGLAQLPQFAGSRADFETGMRRKWLMTEGRLAEKGV